MLRGQTEGVPHGPAAAEALSRRRRLRAAAPPTAPSESSPIEHVGGTSVRVRGAVSGRVYTFTPYRRIQQVDAADVPLLLRSRLFRAAP